MLPEILVGSYRQYKEDTTTFTTWLAQQAKACGYTEPLPSNGAENKAPARATPENPKPSVSTAPRLKGKARKLAKEEVKCEDIPEIPDPAPSVKYKLSTQEILLQVNAVATWTKKRIRMPLSVQSVLMRAINARKRCAVWFQKKGVDDASSQGHSFFIEVLEAAYVALKGPEERPQKQARSTKTVSDKNATELGNRFAALNVECISDSLNSNISDASESSRDLKKKKKKTNPKSKKIDSVIYEPEIDMVWETRFTLFCFFEDLHNIQKEIAKVWTKFNANEVDLVSAAVITLSGVELVRRAEKEMYHTYPEVFPRRSYMDIIHFLCYFTPTLEVKESTPNATVFEVNAFDEFVYLPTAQILFKFLAVNDIDLSKGPWPPAIVPLARRFVDPMKPEEINEWERKTAEEDLFLSQLLLDMILQDKMAGVARSMEINDRFKYSTFVHDDVKSSLHDKLTASTCDIWRNGTLSVYHVFLARTILDIRQVCNKSFQGAGFLAREGRYAAATFQFSLSDHHTLNTGDVNWPAKDSPLLKQIFQLIGLKFLRQVDGFMKREKIRSYQAKNITRRATEEDMEAVARRHHSEAHGRDFEKFLQGLQTCNHLQLIEPNQDCNFMADENPLYTGLCMLNLAVHVGEAGIELANEYQSIFAVAHIFNAWKHIGHAEALGIEWPEMEKLLEAQLGPLFAGEYPTTPETMYARYLFRSGCTSAGSTTFKKKKPWRFQIETAKALRQLLGNEELVEEGLASLQEQFESREKMLPGHKTASKKGKAPRSLTPLQFMRQLGEHIPALIKQMQIDYVGLTRLCNDLMQRVRMALESRLDITFARYDHEDENVYLAVANFILENNASALKEFYKVARSGEQFGGGSGILVALEIFETFHRDFQDKEGDARRHVDRQMRGP
ncbi:hypothetical protein LOZ58_005976 [Ophidiomyces ophidiicola]|nr:hypothetical protein LOZ58_005976 [Ophidiomyces ophidiicola]